MNNKETRKNVVADTLKSLWAKLVKFAKGILRELGDIHNLTIFGIVVLFMSIPIWLLYLLGILLECTPLIAVGTVYWAFWLGPMTPFFPLCVAIALGVRRVIDRYRAKKGLPPLCEIKVAWWEKIKAYFRNKREEIKSGKKGK